MADADWRTDPRWRLVEWSSDFWTSAPVSPSPQAELCGGGSWAAHFDGGRPVAQWYREIPFTDFDKEFFTGRSVRPD